MWNERPDVGGGEREKSPTCPWIFFWHSLSEKNQEGNDQKAQVLLSGDNFIKMLGLDFSPTKWDLVKVIWK